MFMIYVLSMSCSCPDLCRSPQHGAGGAGWGLNTDNCPLPGRFKHAAQSDRSGLRSQLSWLKFGSQKVMMRWRSKCKVLFGISSYERQEEQQDRAEGKVNLRCTSSIGWANPGESVACLSCPVLS